MTTLLALDTATEACSVALWHNGEHSHYDEIVQRSHTQRILPMIDEILSQSGISLKQVDALVFGRGPGSFTGVRVAAGIAQGLALGANLPVIPVSNLTAMAQAAYEQQNATQVIAAIDARMNEVYFSQLQAEKVRSDSTEFIKWRNIIAEQVNSPQNVIAQLNGIQGKWTAVGTGWAAYTQFTQAGLENHSAITLPSSRYMLPIALTCWHANQFVSATEIEPIYLRNQVTWKKLPGRE